MADIVFSCPFCNEELAVEEAGAGLQLPCPGCDQIVTVPTVQAVTYSDKLAPTQERIRIGVQPTTPTVEHVPEYLRLPPPRRPWITRLKTIAVIVLLVIGAIIVCVSFGFWNLKRQKEEDARKRLYEIIERAAPYAKLSFEEVHVSLFKKSISVDYIQVRPRNSNEAPLMIDHLIVHAWDSTHGIPRELDMELSGIAFPESASSTGDFKAERAMRELGYETIRGRIRLQYRFAPETKHLSMTVTAGVINMGELSGEIQLENITVHENLGLWKDIFAEENVAQVTNAFANIRVGTMQLVYRDESFIERYLKLVAEYAGISKSSLLERLAEELDLSAKQTPNFEKMRFYGELKKFLQNPTSCGIIVNPKYPIAISQLMREDDKLLQLLDPQIQIGNSSCRINDLDSEQPTRDYLTSPPLGARNKYVPPSGENFFSRTISGFVKAGEQTQRLNRLERENRVLQSVLEKVRKQSQGRQILNAARMMDAAIDQWALEEGKKDGDTVIISKTVRYLKGQWTHTDLLGNSFAVSVVGSNQLKISPLTKSALDGVGIDWGQF